MLSQLYFKSNKVSVIFQVVKNESKGKSLVQLKLDLESCQESIRPRILHRYIKFLQLLHTPLSSYLMNSIKQEI